MFWKMQKQLKVIWKYDMKRTIDHQKEGRIRGMKRFLVLFAFTVVSYSPMKYLDEN